MNSIIERITRGSVLTKFYAKGKPEKRLFSVRMNTRQLIWSLPTNVGLIEGCIDLYEIKQVRRGRSSKIFDKWPVNAKKFDQSQCFVIYYGSTFRLKSISCSTSSQSECDHWVAGLNYLVKETIEAPNPIIISCWLNKAFQPLENNKDLVSLKDVKNFLARVSCKLSSDQLKEVCQELIGSDLNNTSAELTFQKFYSFYHQIIFVKKLFTDYFVNYSAGHELVTLDEFGKFLLFEQNDPLGEDVDQLKKELNSYFKTSNNSIINNNVPEKDPFFTLLEFMDYLFSKQNTIWDHKFDCNKQDLTRPLTHYWIASSHNTYLTGDQLKSESSVEAYVRCLRMGCRCIELDCWDGSDGSPIIYHGRTLTSKIKFVDAVIAIKEHAFDTSDLPVILSIENHCSLSQQRKMAQIFREVLGSSLVTSPIDKDETQMPSPLQLKRRFMIKVKFNIFIYLTKKNIF